MSNSSVCTNPPDQTPSDAGVAGQGVLLSFIITAALAITISGVIIFYEMRRSAESKILRRLLNSLSDQQIITGIGIQSVGLAKLNTMVPYHFFIIWMLSLLSTATHLATLLALVNDFKRDWILRWLRQFLMFVNLVLSCVFGVLVLRVVMRGMDPTLPVACVFEDLGKDNAAQTNAGLSIAATIGVMAGSCLVFVLGVWYLHSRRRKWTVIIQIVGLFFLAALGAGAAIRVILLSSAFGDPSVPLDDQDEKDWSFGQLLPLLLLLLPVVSTIEIARGETRIPNTISDDSIPLVEPGDKPLGHDPFQPNPFWNSQANIFKK